MTESGKDEIPQEEAKAAEAAPIEAEAAAAGAEKPARKKAPARRKAAKKATTKATPRPRKKAAAKAAPTDEEAPSPEAEAEAEAPQSTPVVAAEERAEPVDPVVPDADDDEDGDDLEDALWAQSAAMADVNPEEITAEEPEIPAELVDSQGAFVVKRLMAKGFEAYLTGGCVRDLLLGRTPKDFDVATSAKPQEVKAAFHNCRLIGRRFLLAHITFPGGKIIETATFRANPLDELEDLPEDLLVKRDNVYGNLEDDARRRDLTINGLFYNPVDGKVIDHVGGRADLEARLIRTIGDPDIRFQEDPVRILRAIKFATRLDFQVEEKTWEAMKNHAGELVRCAPARILEELVRLLTSGHAKRAFSLCNDAGILDALLPELMAVLKGDDPNKALHLCVDLLQTRAQQRSEEQARRRERMTRDEARGAEGEEPPAADTAPQGAEEADSEDDGEEEAQRTEALPEERASPTAMDETDADAETEEPESVEPEVITFVPAAGSLPPEEERLARFFSLLDALDMVQHRKAAIPSEVAFGTILLAGWEALGHAEADRDFWLKGVFAGWAERLRFTRWDRERIAELLPALARFSPERRRGREARSLARRHWFREAMLLHIIALQARGEGLEEIGLWKVVAREVNKPYKQQRGEGRAQRKGNSRRRAPRKGRRGDGRGRGRGRGRSR
jgi:poly(A) polymerase